MHGRRDHRVAALMLAMCGMPLAVEAQPLDYAAYEQLFGEAVTSSVTGAPQRRSDVPATMEIVTASEIRRSGARTIPEVLRRLTGVEVMQWSHDHMDVAVRGYNQAFSPRLLVLVDGRQVYADHYGFTPWTTLPVELAAIRQIEVVKGPSSALFGFNAVDGAINIITYNPLHEQPQSVSVAAGTQNLRQASAVSTYELGEAGAVKLTAGTRRNDDFSTPQPQSASVGTRRGARRDAFSADARFEFSDNVQGAFETTFSEAAQVEFPPNYTASYGVYETRSLKAEVSADTSGGLLTASVYRNILDVEAFTGTQETPLVRFANEVTVAKLRNIFKIGAAHTFRVSAEYRDNGLNTTPIEGGRVGYDLAAIGGMWSWSVTPSLSFTNALRYDRLSLERNGTTPPAYGLDNTDWNRTLTERTFNTGLVWELDARDTLRFMTARGAQLPSLFNFGGQLMEFPPFGYFGGVPFVDPSIVTSYEIAWDRRLDGTDGTLHVAVFDGSTRDILSLSGDTMPERNFFGTAANVGDSTTFGLEASIDAGVGERWRWGASYRYQDVEDDVRPTPELAALAPGFTPLELTFINYEDTTPEHVLKGDLSWTRGRWEVDATLRYQSDTHGIRGTSADAMLPTLVPISDYVAVDGRLGYRISDDMNVSLSGRNLAHDEQRQTSAAAVERTLLARFQYSF